VKAAAVVEGGVLEDQATEVTVGQAMVIPSAIGKGPINNCKRPWKGLLPITG